MATVYSGLKTNNISSTAVPLLQQTTPLKEHGSYTVSPKEESPPPPSPSPPPVPVVTEVVVVNSKPSARAFHIVTTAQGTPNHWQARVHYYWYKQRKEECHKQPDCDMGGFTRLLHSGAADDLMDEIPTIVVDPLPETTLKHTYYVVLNRPFAFKEWIKTVSIPEKYVLMAEADHLFLRPLRNLMIGEIPAAAPFSYIDPARYQNIVEKFTGPVSSEELRAIPHIGNSPTIMSYKDLSRVAEIWLNTSVAIWNDKEAHEAWSWILEMYGFTLATHIAGLRGISTPAEFMAHPPWDTNRVCSKNNELYYILHFTYPMTYNISGHYMTNENDTTWKFDKRSYSSIPPPRNLPPPQKNIQSELIKDLINMINQATSNIPCWDKYAKSGHVEPCDEVIPSATT